MPVVTIASETNVIYNEIRYYIRIDKKFIKGFGTLEEAEQFAEKLVANGGKELSGETIIKEIIC